MKRVIIGIKNGQPYVVNCPSKIEVVFRVERKRTLKKHFRTLVYKISSFFKRS